MADCEEGYFTSKKECSVEEYKTQQAKPQAMASGRVGSSSYPPASANESQSSLNTFNSFRRVSQLEQREIDRHLAAMVPTDYLPMTFVEGPGLRVSCVACSHLCPLIALYSLVLTWAAVYMHYAHRGW
jgi:hypothetical protein